MNGLRSTNFIGHPSHSHKKCGGYSLVLWQERYQLPLVELMLVCTLIVATAVLFVTHK